jgi:hypothetical protein
MNRLHPIEILGTIGLLALIAIGIANDRDEMAEVFVQGHHHMLPKRLITEYHVNSGVGGSVWFDGGGEMSCCLRIPRRWRSGLVADVRWVVWDWSGASDDDINRLNFDSARLEGIYRAQVPVDEYVEPGNVGVHFFSGGKVRLISPSHRVDEAGRSTKKDGTNADAWATQGTRLKEVYSKQEIAAKLIARDKFRQKYGDWR